MTEHLVDFSLSQASLPQGQGIEPLAGPQYKLLMAAESELVTDLGEVLEDCLKLVGYERAAAEGIAIPVKSTGGSGSEATNRGSRPLFNANESLSLHVNAQ